jgi:PAS domain S-box-containing protein
MFSLLYIDDEPGLLEIGRLFLESTGDFSVTTALSGKAGLEQLTKSEFDAVIADYQMPEMDGIELLKNVRKSYGNIPFILFTGRGREEVVIEAINNGVDFYLQKGGDPKAQFAELAHKIRQALSRRKAEIALSDSEKRLADIINFLPDATFAIDTDGKVIAWNHAIEEMTGVPAADMVGKGDYEYAVPFYHSRRPILIDLIFEPENVIANKYANITRHKDILSADTILPRPKGVQATLMGVAGPLYDRKGKLIGSIESIRDITDRKKAEEALRQSEERYRTLAEISPDAILVHQDGRIVYANPAALHLVGASRYGEITGKPLMEFIQPDSRDLVSMNVQSDVRGEHTPAVEVRMLRLDGQSVVVEGSGVLTTYEGRPAVQVAIRDISERRQAEEKIRESEQKYRTVFETTGTAMVLIEDDATISLANSEFLRLTGFDRSEIEKRKRWTDFVVKEDLERMLAQHRLRRSDPKSALKNYEFRLVTQSGEIRDIYLSVDIIPGTKKSVASLLDITERKKAETDLIAVNREYINLLDQIQDIYYRSDTQGRLVRASRSLATLLGYDDISECLGKNIADSFYFNPSDREQLLEEIERHGKVTGYEILLKRKDGTQVLIEASSHNYFDSAGNVIGIEGTFRDITERKRTEEELRAANEQLAASSEELRDQFDKLVQSEARSRMNETRLTYMLGFYEYARKSERELLEYAIEGSGIVTGSSLGYLAFVNEDESELSMYAWSKAAMAECSMREKPIVYKTAKTGLWGEAIRQRRPIITNDYAAPNPVKKGYPEGHPQIIRHMNVPIMDEGRIVLVAGVANKQSDYTENDVNELLILMQGLWTIIQRKRVEEEQKAAYEQLAAAGEELKAQYDVLAKSGEQIRESEERFRSIVEISPYPIAISDISTGRYLLSNAAFQRITGYSEEEIIGKDARDLGIMTPEDQERRRGFYQSRNNVESEVFTIIARDGKRSTVLISFIQILLNNQPVILTMAVDITERKRIEEALRESEAKFRQLITSAPLPLSFANSNGEIEFINNRFTELFGYTHAEVPTLEEWFARAYPDREYRKQVLDTWDAAVKKVSANNTDIEPGEYIVTCRDGSIRNVIINGIIIEGKLLAIFIDITGRKRAEDALFNSQQMLQAVLDSIPQRVFWKDRNSVYLGCNMPLARDAGYPDPKDLIGKDDYATASKATADLYRADDRRVMETGQPRINFEEPQIRPDGGQAWLRTTKVPLRNKEGDIIGVLGTYEDITDEKRTEEALRENEEKYRTLVESSFDGIAIHQDGILVYVNRTAARILGSENPDDFIGRNAIDIVVPAFHDRIAGRVQQAPARAMELIREQFLRLDGTPIDVDVTTTPATWQGKPAAYVTFRDITAQVRTEAALRENEEKYRTLVEVNRDIIYSLSTEGTILYVGPQVTTQLGYQADEMEGRAFKDFIHPDDVGPLLLHIQEHLTAGKAIRQDRFRVRRKDGVYRWFEDNTIYATDRQGRQIVAGTIRDITEEKAAQDALRESEEKFRALVETTSDFIWEVDAGGTYTYVSPQVHRILGYEPEELLGKTPFDIMPPGEAERVAAEFTRCAEGRRPIVALENKAVRKDGSVVVLETSGVIRTAKDGSYQGYRGIDRDITLRKQAEEALRESEARLGSILHGSPVLQFVIDRNHQVISWNNALEDYSGIKAADMIGTDQQWRAFYTKKRPVLADLLIDGDTERIGRLYVGKLRKSRYVEGAYEATDFFPQMGSSGIWLSFTAAPIRDVQGTIIGAVETLEDVTERINAENALRESEEWTRTILNTAQAGIVLVDAKNHRIVDANRKTLELIGLPRDSVVGTVCHRFICPAEEGRCPVTDLGHEVNTSERILLTATGARIPVLKTVVRISMGGRDLLVESFVDISEQKRSEEAVREANRKLNLLNSITRHDIRNQLMVAQGYTQLAALNKPDPVIMDFLAKITAAIETIQRQIEFTKAYQELGVNAPSWFLVNEVVRSGRPEKIALRNTCKDVEIFADPMIDKVFFNLFDNAVKYGERVTSITVACNQKDSSLVITFADNGVGIPAGEKGKVFEKGYGKNTGFGLFLVREILAITGITITETGTHGTGAVFEITVPEGAYRKAG